MLPARTRTGVRLAVGIVRITRIRTTLSAPVLTLLGWVDVGQLGHQVPWKIASSLLSSFALIAFSQVFNDIADMELDAEAKPYRPIPAGLITVSQAWGTVIALTLITIGAAIVTSVVTLCYATVCLILSVLYSARLKNTILMGNLTVAVVSCAMFTYGSSSASLPWGREASGTILIFLYTLGNELYKTAADEHEDAAHGFRTIATVYDLRVTARAVAVVTAALLTALTIVCVTRLAPFSFGLTEAIALGVPVVCGAITANRRRNVTPTTFIRSHRFWRLAWVPGMLALLLLRLRGF